MTLNKGFPTAAWFDLASLDENKLEDETSIMRAVDKLHDAIDEEISRSKVPSTKTMLAGFSQGGALAMYAALTYHKRLAAVIVMSSWPVLRHTVPDVSILVPANEAPAGTGFPGEIDLIFIFGEKVGKTLKKKKNILNTPFV